MLDSTSVGMDSIKPPSLSISDLPMGRPLMYERPRVLEKNIVADNAVALDRKFAEPEAPKKDPALPEPKAAPMSAPLPCCKSTKAIVETAEINCAVIRML